MPIRRSALTPRHEARAATLAVVAVATLLVLVVFTTVMTTVGQTAGSFGASVSWQT